MPPVTDYRQHLEVETPEHVVIDYEIAGLGSRALAALADSALVVLLVAALGAVGLRAGPALAPYVLPFLALAGFGVLWGYFALFEGLMDGQTPGKRWMGIRVIRDTGHPVTMRESASRNLVRLADFLPPPYLLGIVLIAFHPRGKRLGDLVAGTVVVRDRPVTEDLVTARRGGAGGPAAEEAQGPPLLSDEEFRVVRQFAARAPQLDVAVRKRLAAQLAARFADRFPLRERSDVAFLRTLVQEEGARRRGRFGVRTGGRRGAGGGAIERLVARKQERWGEFGALAARGARGGLEAFGADELPDFAARYREVASDLARARTYGADPVVRTRLERLVAAGHNLLYRDDRKTWGTIWRFAALECPAAVVQCRRVILLAFLAFAVPAAGGYLALRERPGLAEEALPAALLERAEEGRAAATSGGRYGETALRARGFVSSAIITNNLGVAFACFAGGIFLGVGSLLSLAINGLMIGAASGHFHNAGLLAYLWTFVAGHGVLELFAIWCAGGAGFLLGMAVLRPGDHSRRDALVLNGRLAVRLVGAAVLLLLVAGTIEGFLSTSAAPVTVKVGASLGSAVFLVAWLAIGERYARRRGAGDGGTTALPDPLQSP